MIEHGAQEGRELGIASACTANRVDGRLRVGMSAACIGELGAITGFVLVQECAGFVNRVVVGDAVESAVETFFGEERFLLLGKVLGREVGGQLVKTGNEEYLRCASARFEPTSLVRQLGTLGRVLLEIARVFHDVRFLLAFHDNPAAFVAVLFLTVDDVVGLAQCPVNLVKRVR